MTQDTQNQTPDPQPSINIPTSLTREKLWGMSFNQIKAFYADILTRGNPEEQRWMCRHDRFFLLVAALSRKDCLHPWIYGRCREVEREPEGFLDLWSRFHYKTTLISHAGAIQEILRNPNITIGIFSHTLSLSKKLVGQIQRDLESPRLINLFPDILHEKPPQRNWSAETGLIVIRDGNPKEPTIQACGLVDGQPIGAHYDLRIYDDIVTPKSVSTPEQIEKTTQSWELSLALGTAEGGREWYAGTRYHPHDTYQELIDRKAVTPRIRICYDNNGDTVLMSKENLEEMRSRMGERTFASQMLQNPIGLGIRSFRDEWFHTLETLPSPASLNRYIFIDSATSKRRDRDSDYTVMVVVGLGRDRNYYLMDGIRDRMSLAERTRALFSLIEQWTPNNTFWEQVGLASDVEHIQSEQQAIGWHFPITPISQTIPKLERIRWLEPLFEAGRIWFPNRILKQALTGEAYDFTLSFLEEEFKLHPACRHDDMLDALANIKHPQVAPILKFPVSPVAAADQIHSRTVNKRYRAFSFSSR